MNSEAVVVENVSKLYQLGAIGTRTLSHDINRWWYRVRGKEDPYAKIGETNVRSTRGDSDFVWALRDVSFNVMQGEVLGIIGNNGAGKSTLLKILSRVTTPTEGCIKVRGRIASLLEVGTGFHPELTGRENIYLNGAILGMSRQDINGRLDEIVDFSGCERYIDTPVKRYSSGMYVRLAFSVAAHLEPDILVVDEVLAVGDVEFQRKSLGKLESVSKNAGRSVLFVSHNLAAIERLCQRTVLVANGSLKYNGPTNAAISKYLSEGSVPSRFDNSHVRKGNGAVRIVDITFRIRDGSEVVVLSSGAAIDVCLKYEMHDRSMATNLIVSLQFRSEHNVPLFLLHNRLTGDILAASDNEGHFVCSIDSLPLPVCRCTVSYSVMSGREYLDGMDAALTVDVAGGSYNGYAELPPVTHGLFLVKAGWHVRSA